MQRVGRPLALFAIFLQMAYVFGHHHFDMTGSRGSAAAAFALSQQEQTTSTPDDSRRHQIPAAPAHGPCLLCATIHAAASLDAGAPQLVLPFEYAAAPVTWPTVASILPLQRVAAFDARGPPRA